MKKAKTKKIITAISLQGGGALGAYEYGAIKALYASRGKSFFPRVVTGVSIGAINAALLVGAKGDPMEALDRLWRERLCVDWPAFSWFSLFGETLCDPFHMLTTLSEQSLSLFGNPGMYQLSREFMTTPVYAPMMTSSIYDTSLLKETLAEFVDPKKLNHPEKTRLIVTAVNVGNGQYARFDNAQMMLTLDHIIASGSFPVTFPMTPIAGDFYWDGGIFLNLPVGVAVNALEQIEPDNPDIEREIIMVSLHRMKGELPKTIQESCERFYNLLFSGKFALDKKLHRKYSAFVDAMQEIDKILPANSPIRKHEGYKDLVRHRKIDRTVVIGEEGTGAIGSSSDFSRRTLTGRIDAGFNDAMVVFNCSSK